MTLECWSLLSG